MVEHNKVGSARLILTKQNNDCPTMLIDDSSRAIFKINLSKNSKIPTESAMSRF